MSVQQNTTDIALLKQRVEVMEKKQEVLDKKMDKLFELRWKVFGAGVALLLFTSSAGNAIANAVSKLLGGN